MKENQLFSYLNIGLPEDILRMKMHGDLDGAVRLIDKKLANQGLPEELRYCLTAEREMILRMPSDYPFTHEDALKKIREHIPEFSEEEFQEHLASGQIRWIYVNGEMRIFDRFFESMCKSMPEFRKRAAIDLEGAESAGKGSQGDLRLNRAVKIMKEKGSLSNRIRIRASVKVNDSEFTPGMFVRVHLPIPAACEQQSQIRIESVYPEHGQIAPEDAPQRTVCWEEYMKENHEFTVEYSYVHTAVWHDTEAALELAAHSPGGSSQGTVYPPDGLIPEPSAHSPDGSSKGAVYPPDGLIPEPSAHFSGGSFSVVSSGSGAFPFSCAATEKLPEFSSCTGEMEPHIVFSPYIRTLVKKLSKDCTTPLEQARNFYDFITLNFKYTYMPAYFSLENIPENCARSFTGDCGVFALLFLTMCRCAGIPAQWQSGLAAEPDFIGGHDWVRFYAAPFGWLYADTSYGIGAVRAENEERRRFYFGNLDPYRMVANNAFQAPFTIDKSYWRTDPYDNQLGEIETAERGLRYEEYIRTKEILMCEEI